LPLFFFSISNYLFNRGAVVAVIVLDLQLPMQSVSITTKVVSWNPVHGEVSSIHWTLCDKVCQWFTTGRWFSPWTPVSSINKTAHHDITAILMKVALNTINQTDWQWINGYIRGQNRKKTNRQTVLCSQTISRY
jgi:hypothetical protein